MFPNKIKSKLKSHKGSIYSLEFSKDGTYCMSGGVDPEINLWNPEKELLIKTYPNEHGAELRDIKIRSDNCQFASCGSDKNIFVWDVSNGKIIRRIRGHQGCVNSISYNKQETVLISGSFDRKVCAWDLRTNSYRPIQSFGDFCDSVSSITISDDKIFSGSIDGRVMTFDIRKGRVFKDHFHNPVTSIQLSNDKNCLLVTVLVSKIFLLDKETGDVLNTYKGHKNGDFLVRSDFTFDDAYVLSGSEDGLVYVWNLVEAEKVFKLEGHKKICTVVKANPITNNVLTADCDGNIFYWECSKV